MRIELPFSGVIGQGRSINANSGDSVNLYLEITAEGKPILIGTPGLELAFTLPQSPVRGCYSDDSTSYWVAGNGFYKRTVDNVVTLINTINTSFGTVKFISSGTNILFVDGVNGYNYTIATNTMTVISGGGFPNNPIDIKYLNGYFIVIAENSQQFNVAAKATPGTWNALDFATAEGRPDFNAGIEIYQNELVIFGYRSIEFWTFTGNVDFPLERNANAVLDQGIIAPRSTGRTFNSVLWLGADNTGNGVVWMMEGYTPIRVSTHEIEERIAALPFVDDAFSIVYQQEGHMFYILQFPSSNATFCYDVTSKAWHTRNYRESETGDLLAWRGSCLCYSSEHLVGDSLSGNVYRLSLDVYTDNGDEIPRIRKTPVIQDTQKLMFFNELIVYMETGVGLTTGQGSNPKLKLRWSNDSGHTWSSWREGTIGSIGEYGKRCKFNMLGMGRNRVWELYIADPVKVVLQGIELEINKGYS